MSPQSGKSRLAEAIGENHSQGQCRDGGADKRNSIQKILHLSLYFSPGAAETGHALITLYLLLFSTMPLSQKVGID